MTDPHARVLLIGFGNPARGDDGLGIALAAAVAELGIEGVTVESDYQLNVEHAADIARHDVVVFADADLSLAEAYSFRKLEPKPEINFSSHSVSPAGVLGLAQKLFAADTNGYLLGIRGHVFREFVEGLSAEARGNLQLALGFIETVLRSGTLPDTANTDEPATAPSR